MIKLYAVNVKDELTPEEIEILSSYLSLERQAKIKRFYHFIDLKRSLIGDILVRWEICKSLGCLNKDIYFDVNDYGKPNLRGGKDFHFNVSHAGDWVVMACHRTPVGVDIEEIKPIEMKIAERFFSQYEYQDLMKLDESQQLGYFFNLWSLKESYIKAEGKGLSIPLDSFSFSIDNEEIQLTIHKGDQKDYYFRMYSIDPSYKMALCTLAGAEIPETVEVIKIKDLYREAKKLLDR